MRRCGGQGLHTHDTPTTIMAVQVLLFPIFNCPSDLYNMCAVFMPGVLFNSSDCLITDPSASSVKCSFSMVMLCAMTPAHCRECSLPHV